MSCALEAFATWPYPKVNTDVSFCGTTSQRRGPKPITIARRNFMSDFFGRASFCGNARRGFCQFSSRKLFLLFATRNRHDQGMTNVDFSNDLSAFATRPPSLRSVLQLGFRPGRHPRIYQSNRTRAEDPMTTKPRLADYHLPNPVIEACVTDVLSQRQVRPSQNGDREKPGLCRLPIACLLHSWLSAG